MKVARMRAVTEIYTPANNMVMLKYVASDLICTTFFVVIIRYNFGTDHTP